MRYAMDEHGTEITATPGAEARCFGCGENVFAKCGHVIGWHWCHKAGSLCVHAVTEPETSWHQSWKLQVPARHREVTVRKGGRTKRADIKAKTQTVIELQHSDISRGELLDREDFYGRNMFWIFDSDGQSRQINRSSLGNAMEWNGFKQYEVSVEDRVAGVGASGRPSLVDIRDYVCRVVPHPTNTGKKFQAVIIPAEQVRQAVQNTCHDSDPAVSWFMLDVGATPPKSRTRTAIEKRGSLSRGEYIQDYCPHATKGGQEVTEHSAALTAHAERVSALQKRGWSVWGSGQHQKVLASDMKTIRTCIRLCRFGRVSHNDVFLDVSDGTCVISGRLQDVSFEEFMRIDR